MTEPRDPTEPAADRSTDNDPHATARIPLPADPATPVAAAAPPAWTTPPPAPAWQPGHRSDDGRGPSIVFGLILLAVGLWFFAEHTLGLDLPTLRWNQLWPLILIVVGVWVLFSARRRAR